MSIIAPRGVKDILPVESYRWRYLEEQFANVCRLLGYREIRLPIFEHTELFKRGVGEATDIVQKEMYTFLDRSERSLTLRPELTAGIVRSFIEHKLYTEALPLKLFSFGPQFRYERPKAGRYRQFHQFDIEIFGAAAPIADAEIIALGMQFFTAIGLDDTIVELNSIGCAACRPAHRLALTDYLQSRLENLCSDCINRSHINPLRVFDCKNTACQAEYTALPIMRDYLCTDCSEHFGQVCELLGAYGISYTLNDRLVRGLDYYNRTVFEYFDPKTLEIGSLGGGGRYDPLVAEIGGPDTPGIGFALGAERILISLADKEIPRPTTDLFLAVLGEAAIKPAIALQMELTKNGICTEMDLQNRSLKTQMRHADRLGAMFTAILGEDELAKKQVLLRDMQTKEQVSLAWDELVNHIKNKITT